MRLYVIGPVTGIEDDNRPAFEEAAEALADAGYDPLIPHWFVPEGAPWDKAMRRSIETMLKCDGVAALEGFGASRGARIEADLAASLDIPVKTVAGSARWKQVGKYGTNLESLTRQKIPGAINAAHADGRLDTTEESNQSIARTAGRRWSNEQA